MFQEYKRQFNIEHMQECSVRFGDVDLDFEVHGVTFEPDLVFTESKEKYNRAQVKREYQKVIDEALYDFEHE